MTKPTRPGAADAGLPENDEVTASPRALLETLDELINRAIDLTRQAAAELARERLDGLLEQLHLRDLLLTEMGTVLARLGSMRDSADAANGFAWTDAAEAAWGEVANRLVELSGNEAELARNLLQARDVVSIELERLQQVQDPGSTYQRRPGPPQIDRQG